uniref:Uncharacterized protein n=1 Tax=Anguilla anguilla TaxID=7936 RepID=A0A0E9VR20_ANGAN
MHPAIHFLCNRHLHCQTAQLMQHCVNAFSKH